VTRPTQPDHVEGLAVVLVMGVVRDVDDTARAQEGLFHVATAEGGGQDPVSFCLLRMSLTGVVVAKVLAIPTIDLEAVPPRAVALEVLFESIPVAVRTVFFA
jgi:hypothetical protein